MNLYHLQTFLAVADEGSFTRAAEVLDVSKGLVSRHIQKLENNLSTKLFYRSTRKIVLTEVGVELYSKAKQIQRLSIEAEIGVKDITQEVSGELKVTAPFEFGKVMCREVIPSFRRVYPDVILTLDFGYQKKLIESGDFDIAIRAYDDLPNDVIAIDLGYIRNVLVCSNGYLSDSFAHDISHLHNYDFILNSQEDRWNNLELHSDNEKREVSILGSLSANTYHSILELVKQGLGIASLPYYQVCQYLEQGELVQMCPLWSVRTHKLSLIYSPRKITPQKIKAFNKQILNWLKEKPQYTM
jgi:DNA-binding transcriptional LysR family regulator